MCIFYENSLFFLIGCFLCTLERSNTKIETDFAKKERERERKKERKKEIIAIRRHTHKRLTRVPKGGKGKKGSKAQASDGRRARFLFAVVRRVFETE